MILYRYCITNIATGIMNINPNVTDIVYTNM